MQKWIVKLDDYYGMELKPDTARRWYEGVAAACKNLTDEELAGAVEYAANNDFDTFGPPNVKDLIKWVRERRTARRTERARSHVPAKCQLCSQGWVEIEYERKGRWGTEMVPCLCTEGKRMLAMVYPEHEHAYVISKSNTAKQQQIERNKDTERWTQKWYDAGQPSVAEIFAMIGWVNCNEKEAREIRKRGMGVEQIDIARLENAKAELAKSRRSGGHR